MKLSEIVLGLDMGGTIHHKVSGETVPMPHAFRVINDLRQRVKAIYIVSRVSDEQSLQAFNWLHKVDFFGATGLTPNKVHYCYERLDKGPICWKLGVTHFVDDRPEVMFGLQSTVERYLMNPSPYDMETFKDRIPGMTIVHDWLTLENLILAHE